MTVPQRKELTTAAVGRIRTLYESEKEISKNLKKGVDKWGWAWYYIRALERAANK